MSSRRPTASRFELAGAAGAIECLIEQVGHGEDGTVAVICHPHPLHGGTMDNKVVYTVSRALHQLDISTVRFNFRGVGQSAGKHDDGRGETEDTLAVVDWARAEFGGKDVWLAGFSFGAWVSVRAAAHTDCARLISVAPPVKRYGIAEETQPACPWLIVQGSADEVVSCDAVITWFNQLQPGPELVVLPGADHFFHGALTVLKNTLIENLAVTNVSAD